MNQLKEHPFPLVEYKISTGILPMVESPFSKEKQGYSMASPPEKVAYPRNIWLL